MVEAQPEFQQSRANENQPLRLEMKVAHRRMK
jgi:hypothetical protein